MAPSPRRLPAAVICTPGLEFVTRRELEALGLKPKPAGTGTIEIAASPRQLYAANVWLRSATRVVVRLATFRATDFRRLQEGAAEIDWAPWMADGVAPRFRISCNQSKLYHTQAIAQRLHQVVAPPSTGEPEHLFVVRIERNTVTISVDASGDALHHRPWRTELGAAPLRTSMAAALLLAAGWDGTTNLCDPFCGSGTIPIEAALLAANRPPGGERSFAFMDWPSFEPGTWASVRGEVTAAARPLQAAIHAADRDGSVVAMARANAERAGVADEVSFAERVVSHLPALPGPGTVATNPPYGRRVGDGRLDGLYQRFGAVVRERLPEWELAMVCADPKLAAKADGRLRRAARFRHGGLKVELLARPAVPATATTEADHAPQHS
ncbi:MAG: class I SAM-dependent RNA methyltransferase [Actinomycetota bacterium]